MRKKRFPRVAAILLGVIILASLLAPVIAPYDPTDMNENAISLAPSLAHPFGTDTMGRDLFTMVLFGGRASLAIGLASSLLATAIAVLYGTISGLAARRIDDFMMRVVELAMSLPGILLVLFLQAMWGKASLLSLSLIIGVTSWFSIAKIVRSQVRQIRQSDYILSAQIMGGGFFYTLLRHLLPNYVSAIMFMVVSNVGSAMITESTLSFMGLGLPLTTVSWGSLLSMSQDALMSNQWWIILIPGIVLITTLVCITDLGDYIRRSNSRLQSNL